METHVVSQLRALLKRGVEHKTWARQLNTLREQVQWAHGRLRAKEPLLLPHSSTGTS